MTDIQIVVKATDMLSDAVEMYEAIMAKVREKGGLLPPDHRVSEPPPADLQRVLVEGRYLRDGDVIEESTVGRVRVTIRPGRLSFETLEPAAGSEQWRGGTFTMDAYDVARVQWATFKRVRS